VDDVLWNRTGVELAATAIIEETVPLLTLIDPATS